MTPSAHEELKVLTADPSRLRAALNDADAATLLLVLVQFTAMPLGSRKHGPTFLGR